MNLIKTDRQVNYESRKGDGGQYLNLNETPFTVGLSLHVHKTTRSKKLVDLLSNLNLCIPYDKVMKIETALGNAVIKEKEELNGVYVPPNIVYGNHCILPLIIRISEMKHQKGNVSFMELAKWSSRKLVKV